MNRRIYLERSREIFGSPPPVRRLKGKYNSFFHPRIKKMCASDWRDISEDDLHTFIYFIREGASQGGGVMDPQEFDYLFPVFLYYWSETLMPEDTWEKFFDVIAGMQRLLTDWDFFYMRIEPEQLLRVKEYMYDAFLDKFEYGIEFSSNNISDDWLKRLNSFGYYSDTFPLVWESMWSMQYTGSALCCLYYIAELLFKDTKNPIYSTFEEAHGGYLGYAAVLEHDTDFLIAPWLASNVSFLENEISHQYFGEKLQVVERNLAETEYAPICATVIKEYSLSQGLVEEKIQQLLHHFATYKERSW